MLLLSMMTPLFRIAAVVVVPGAKIAFVGRLAPFGPMSQNETVLLSLPFAVLASVAKYIVPPAVPMAMVAEPRTVVRVTVLFVAPFMNRIVLVLAVADAVVLATVSE